jgi:hypothetical protein
MLETERKLRNQALLQELHPAFRVRLEGVLREMEGYGLRPRIQTAWRSPQDQLRAYNEKHSRVKYGFHNVTSADGRKEALAADVIDDNNVTGLGLPYVLHLAAAAQNNGLITGVRWDLTPDKAALIDAALKARNWNARIWVGFDPLHVEVTGITIAEAQSGKRPRMPGEPAPDSGTTGPGDTTTPGPADQPPVVTPPPVPQPARRHFSVQEADTQTAAQYDLPTALRPVSLLAVPHQPQPAPDAASRHNACGSASAVMLLKAYQGSDVTPGSFQTRFGTPGDPLLSVPQIRNGLAALGLPTELRSGLLIQDLFNCLAQNKPAIVLLSYKTLQAAGLTEKTFDGPHFAVVVGLDSRNIYLHDPLYADPGVGEARAFPLDVFWQAWKDAARDPGLPNPERSAIVPLMGIGSRGLRRVRVNMPALNVRSGPGLTFGVVASLPRDTVVEILAESNGWGQIGDQKWISLNYTANA